MTKLSSDASTLVLCLNGPPKRAFELRRQVGWPEQRFNAALAQLVNSSPPMIEICGNVGDEFLVLADDDYDYDYEEA